MKEFSITKLGRANFEVSHPRCVDQNIKSKKYVLDIQSKHSFIGNVPLIANIVVF